MLAKDLSLQMLTAVASCLGKDLLPMVAFVGGCTTALHVTDELALQSIRFTDDVDLIVQVKSIANNDIQREALIFSRLEKMVAES